MHRRRSSRLPKSPGPDEDVIQRRLRHKRRTTGLRKTQDDDSREEQGDLDIIDIISSTYDGDDDKALAEKDKGKFIEVADEGMDKSDEDCCSVTSSIASGPVLPQHARKSLQGLCAACQKLYQRAKKMKAPIKNKLKDNDPTSPTCDQWVLIKSWRPSRRPDTRGRILLHAQPVGKGRKVKNGPKRTERRVEQAEPSGCSRPHAFLQRNLRHCVKVPVKKEREKNSRKRRHPRVDSCGPRVAKQQRLHGSSPRQHPDADCLDNGATSPTSGPSFEGRSEQAMGDPEDTAVTVELISTSVTLEAPPEPPKQKTPKKRRGFRDLLAQLRGKSSMIVREKS